MSVNQRRELSLLAHDEAEVVRATRHPALAELDAKALEATRKRLRELRDKERTLARQKVRESRGKAEPRGGGTAEHRQARKQVFAGALRRANKQAQRLRVTEAKAAQVAVAKKALAMRTAAPAAKRPSPGKTADRGMTPVENVKVDSKTPPAKIGSVSQATKAAQARKDNA